MNPSHKLLFYFCILLLSSCNYSGLIFDPEYERHVGDIKINPKLDDPTFELCHGDEYVAQYFNYAEDFPFVAEKDSLIRLFQSTYVPVNKKGQSGYVRIRFIVNCKGESGRFRITESDFNYQPFQFKRKIIKQLYDITKNIEKWDVISDEVNGPRDYYMYLIFKIKDGQLIEILP